MKKQKTQTNITNFISNSSKSNDGAITHERMAKIIECFMLDMVKDEGDPILGLIFNSLEDGQMNVTNEYIVNTTQAFNNYTCSIFNILKEMKKWRKKDQPKADIKTLYMPTIRQSIEHIDSAGNFRD